MLVEMKTNIKRVPGQITDTKQKIQSLEFNLDKLSNKLTTLKEKLDQI